MTPCAHSHSTSSGVLWPARLSHTSNSRSGGRSCGKLKGSLRPACHTAQAAGVAAASCDEPAGGGSSARIALSCSRSQGCSSALVPRAAGWCRGRLVGAAGGWLVPRAAGWCRGRLVGAAPGLMRDETGSGSWSCRPGCSRAVAGPGGRAAARMRRDAARPETARPRPRTRPAAQAARPACRPARSAPFYRRIGIADAHHAVLAAACHSAGFAPGAALLPAQAGLVQRAPDRIGADPGQPVIRLPQGSLQQAQGPGRRAVLLALGRAGPFGQNALLRISPIADPRAAPCPGRTAASPSRLKRLTQAEMVSVCRRPTWWAATV
jgi:hypothetical protein